MAGQFQVSSRLPLEQRIAVVRIFYSCGCNAAETSRRLSKEFGCPLLHGKTIKAIIDKFNETGSIKVCRSVGHQLKKCIELEGRQVEPYCSYHFIKLLMRYLMEFLLLFFLLCKVMVLNLY